MFDEMAEQPISAADLAALVGMGETVCPVCNRQIDESDLRAERAIIAAEGMPGDMTFVAAHIGHFFQINPATGKADCPTPDYQKNLEIFSLAYLSATGHVPRNQG